MLTQEEKEWVEQILPLIKKGGDNGWITPLSAKLAYLLEKSLQEEE